MWLYWTIFNSAMPPLDVMPQAHRLIINETVENIEKRAGCKIPDGSNPTVTPILLTLDPVNVSFRPFFWYVGIALGNFIARVYLQRRYMIHFGTHDCLE
jgi:hypothetical protein